MTPMIHHYYCRPENQPRLRCGPLAPHLNRFSGLLFEQGYAPTTGQNKIRLVTDLSQWLERRRIPLDGLNEQRFEDFFKARHRHHCQNGSDWSTLMLFLEQLQQDQIIALAHTQAQQTALQRIENGYATFLLQERGVSQLTVQNYLHEVRLFLLQRFNSGKIRLNTLQAKDIAAFILSEARRSPGRIQVRSTALRSFLGFLYQSDQLPTNLATSLPASVAGRTSPLPQFLAPAQVESLLRSCDRDSVVGRRDYAVLMLLARLGLRACEVAQLNLDDINWRSGELQIRGKSAREDRLPLPCDVGQALVGYLQGGRPKCSCRRVFIRLKAPRLGFHGSDAVGNIVKRALQRARLCPERKGAHLLRHSLATRMLRGGASLQQIGQVLRHEQIQTTQIYAKVDLTALRALARRWPGGVK